MIHLKRQVIHSGYDRVSCWVHARCGFVPRADGSERMIVTMQKNLMGSDTSVWDVFSGLSMMESLDGGESWQGPRLIPSLQAWCEPGGVDAVISDFTPQWLSVSGQLLGIGHTCRYREGKLIPSPQRARETAYALWNEEREEWGPAHLLDMPDRDRFFSAGAGSIQWCERADGTLLVPIYYRERNGQLFDGWVRSKVVVLHGVLEKGRFRLLEIGPPLSIDTARGLGEPSLVECGGLYWLTLRNGLNGYVATSRDGLNFGPIEPWRFDDGTVFGCPDTQQHWAKIGGRLFLVYTRRTPDNGHVTRHRAPLFIAEVDQERRVLLRETERIAIPDRGAMLGNFGVGQRNDGEAWICASEWMECGTPSHPVIGPALRHRFPEADLEALAALPGRCGLCELSGSDNSVYLVRVTAG